MNNLAQPSPWFDTPNPNPKRRKPMEQLLVELAERNGEPVWPAQPLGVHGIAGHYHGGGKARKAAQS